MPENPAVIAFTLLYIFAFRETAKTGALWGAFQWPDWKHCWRKAVKYSLPILVVIPWLA